MSKFSVMQHIKICVYTPNLLLYPTHTLHPRVTIFLHKQAIIGLRHPRRFLRFSLRVRFLLEFLHPILMFLCTFMFHQYSMTNEIAGTFYAIMLCQPRFIKIDSLTIFQHLPPIHIRQIFRYLINSTCQLTTTTRSLTRFPLVNSANSRSHFPFSFSPRTHHALHRALEAAALVVCLCGQGTAAVGGCTRAYHNMWDMIGAGSLVISIAAALVGVDRMVSSKLVLVAVADKLLLSLFYSGQAGRQAGRSKRCCPYRQR